MKTFITFITFILFSLSLNAQIFISPNAHLSINGDVRLDTVNNEGNIHVFNSADFYYKQLTGAGSVNAYYAFDAKKRYLVSTPFAQTKVSAFNKEFNKLQNNFWKYVSGWQIVQDTNQLLQPARGYMAASNIFKTVALTGTPNQSASFTFAPGTNLVGNPFLSRLDTTIFSGSLIKNTPGTIPHGRGFFVTNTTNQPINFIFTKNQTIPIEPNLEITESAIKLNGLWSINSTDKGFLLPRLNTDSIKMLEYGMLMLDTTGNIFSLAYVLNDSISAKQNTFHTSDTVFKQTLPLYNKLPQSEEFVMNDDTVLFVYYHTPKVKNLSFINKPYFQEYDSISNVDTILVDINYKKFNFLQVWYVNIDNSETLAKFTEMRNTRSGGTFTSGFNNHEVPHNIRDDQRFVVVKTNEKRKIRIYFY